MRPPDPIIARIQKLLALANSDNEYEAKQATNRANELLIKHNLKLQEVTDRNFSYVDRDAITVGTVIQGYQKMIAGLLDGFFFVKILVGSSFSHYDAMGRERLTRKITLIGTEVNTEIATYIFSYLNESYPRLWSDFRKKNKLGGRYRTSYYVGLTAGISEMLEKTKWRVEHETGLVVVGDPELQKFADSRAQGAYNGREESPINQAVAAAGFRDGVNIKLRKPIESTATTSGLYLSGGGEDGK